MRISDWSSDVCSSDLLEGDALEAADLLAELLALGGVGDRVVEGAARAAHGHGRDGEPGRVEPVVGQLAAAVRLAQDLRRRRSEERRGGKAWVSTCRSRWSEYN